MIVIKIMKKLENEDNFKSNCFCNEINSSFILTGYDIFRIAQFLNQDVISLFDNKSFFKSKDSLGLPIITLAQTENKKCIYSENNKCDIYPNRPLNCLKKDDKDYKKQILDTKSEYKLINENWDLLILYLTKYINKFCKQNKISDVDDILTFIEVELYLNYDISKPYLEQFKKNIEVMGLVLDGFNFVFKE